MTASAGIGAIKDVEYFNQNVQKCIITNQNHHFKWWYAPALQGHITGRA
jgi:hypothetical protein